ncbi:MAG: hemerythrin domain-containing protein [Gammaproteobacteria bacterium]|nr:MAG: hemerythrin domain-containing protein [Gammaproteobacteria bacterium]
MARRHDALIPLAQDHHGALVVAVGLKRAGNGDTPAQLAALRAFAAEWHERLRRHFEDEERLLRPLLTGEEWSRLTGDHAELRHAAQAVARQLEGGVPAAGFCAATGVALERHIRWEDRELFARIEAQAGEAALQALARETSRR